LYSIRCNYKTCGTAVLYLEKPSKSSNHLELFDFVTEFQPAENDERLDSFDIFPVTDLRKQKEKEKKSISQKTSIRFLKN
jgi:hypothetical protein